MKWTQEEIARCQALWRSREYTSREIAAILTVALKREVSFSAVIARMNRSGCSFEGPQSNNVNTGRVPRKDLPLDQLEALRAHDRERDARKRANRREREGLPPVEPRNVRRSAQSRNRSTDRTRARRPVETKPGPTESTVPTVRDSSPKAMPEWIPAPLNIPLLEAKEGQCRFIASDPRDEFPALCCGHTTAEGRPWCPGHRRLCTVPSRPVPVYVPNRRAA